MTFRRLSGAILLPTLLFTLVIAAGCGSKQAAPVTTEAVQGQLLGKKWYCEMMFEREVAGDVKPVLEFMADGTVKGTGGCNSISGNYTLNGEDITIGPLRSTKKSCGAGTDEQEFTFMTLVQSVQKLEVEDEELKLYRDTRSTPMIFTTDDGSGLW